MKKYLIGFGLAMIFFAGFANAETTEPTVWTPAYKDTYKKYEDCKNNDGIWVFAPVTGGEKGGCLAKTACNDLDFDIVKPKKNEEEYDKTTIEVKYENKHYVVAD